MRALDRVGIPKHMPPTCDLQGLSKGFVVGCPRTYQQLCHASGTRDADAARAATPSVALVGGVYQGELCDGKIASPV